MDEAARPSWQPIEFTPAQLRVYGEYELETLAGLLRDADAGKATGADLRAIAHTIAHKIGYRGPEPNREPHRFLQAFYKRQRAELEKRLLYGKRVESKLDR